MKSGKLRRFRFRKSKATETLLAPFVHFLGQRHDALMAPAQIFGAPGAGCEQDKRVEDFRIQTSGVLKRVVSAAY